MNIIDYIKWRGDLNFEQSEFNLVDNLILAYLSYMDFTGIISENKEAESVTLKYAAGEYFKRTDRRIVLDEDPEFLKAVSESVRFGNAKIWAYQDMTDFEKEKTQFAAMCITLEDGSVYISFRGTDNTIVGWEEDFRMSFEIIPAQKYALEYLEKILKNTHDNRIYRCGGHSKGGNLAVYAAMMCDSEVKNKIYQIYSNDGPGFESHSVNQKKYAEIESKIIKIIPDFCIVGALFNEMKGDIVVGSSETGLMAHNALTWQVEGTNFVRYDSVTRECQVCNEIIDTWFESVDGEQREKFVNDLFSSLKADGSKSFREILSSGAAGWEVILRRMIQSEETSKTVLRRLADAFFSVVKKINPVSLFKNSRTVFGFLLFMIGLIFVSQPKIALLLLGIAAVIGVVVYAVTRILYYIQKIRSGEKNEWIRIAFFSILILLCLISIINNKMIIISVNMLMALLLLFKAWQGIKKWSEFIEDESKKVHRRLIFFDAMLSVVFAIMALVLHSGQNIPFIILIGIYLNILGVFNVITGIIFRKKNKKKK